MPNCNLKCKSRELTDYSQDDYQTSKHLVFQHAVFFGKSVFTFTLVKDTTVKVFGEEFPFIHKKPQTKSTAGKMFLTLT